MFAPVLGDSCGLPCRQPIHDCPSVVCLFPVGDSARYKDMSSFERRADFACKPL